MHSIFITSFVMLTPRVFLVLFYFFLNIFQAWEHSLGIEPRVQRVLGSISSIKQMSNIPNSLNCKILPLCLPGRV